MDHEAFTVRARDREPLLHFLLDGLASAGCTILRSSTPTEAPFKIAFETPNGERMGILCYAFLANTKLTKNRPSDEYRFQVKYGSKNGRLHTLWRDPWGLYTTVFVGINPELGLLAGADPEMHNPTRFFISVEFKQTHVQEILRHGWHAWERERRKPDADPVEVLIGTTGDNLLEYIRFERAAEGLDQGHRQLLAEQVWAARGQAPAQSRSPSDGPRPPPPVVHDLAREFELSEAQVLDLIASTRRLKMAVRGWVAEEHLVRTLTSVPGVTTCQRLDEEGGPDVLVSYEGATAITVECKNVLRETAADGAPRIDFQRTRASKADPCSRYYRADDFDVVAACLHAVHLKWQFRYVLPRALDKHKKCSERLASNVRVDSRWSMDAAAVLRAASSI